MDASDLDASDLDASGDAGPDCDEYDGDGTGYDGGGYPVPVPTNVRAEPTTATSVTIYWNQAYSLDGYIVKWKLVGDCAYTTAFSGFGSSKTQHTIYGLSPGVSYEVVVQAWAGPNQSLGVHVTAIPYPFQAPPAPSLSGYYAPAVVITWDSITDAPGYRVQRSPNTNDFAFEDLSPDIDDGTMGYFADSNLPSYDVFYYRYCVHDATYGRVSEWSGMTMVTLSTLTGENDGGSTP